MFSFTYISGVCKQKQMILLYIIIFNALTIYQWCKVPFSTGDKALRRNLYRFKKYSFSENTGIIFEDKLQQEKSENVINRDLGNMRHRPTAWDWQTETYAYWRERDHCGWNARLAKPQSPETNISFNTPDTKRKGSNKV